MSPELNDNSARPVGEVPQLAPARILIVEDDADTRMGLRCHLTANGFDVTATNCGRRALPLVIETSPGAVLLDLGLPDMPGIDVLRAIRNHDPVLPVVIVSAWSEARWHDAVLDAGAAMFLEKPVPPDDLLHALRVLTG